eukprot:8453965-Alexandrium_andersonii.AAC.1
MCIRDSLAERVRVAAEAPGTGGVSAPDRAETAGPPDGSPQERTAEADETPEVSAGPARVGGGPEEEG